MKYPIVAVNAGTDDANNVKIAINLPDAAAASFENADGTNGFNCPAPVSNVVTCVGNLPPGGDTTITVTVTVLLGLVPPADLTLTATIVPTYGGIKTETSRSNEGNNTQTEVTTVPAIPADVRRPCATALTALPLQR